MKFIIRFVVFISCLSIGTSVFAQGQSRGGGAPAVHPEIGAGTIDRDSAGRPSDKGITNSSSSRADHTPKSSNTVSNQISEDTALSSKLRGLLPQGTNLDTAASGFPNKGQFVAAVHVSHNLNIPFDQVKARMMANDGSLGKAIHELKPDLSDAAAKSEAKKAEDQAKEDTKKKS
jgi:hypothetical protein